MNTLINNNTTEHQRLHSIDVSNERGLIAVRVKRKTKQLLTPLIRYKNRLSLRDNLDSSLVRTAFTENRKCSNTPFFIVGHPRSGTTLLREILNRSSELTIPPENGATRAMIDTFRSNRNLEWEIVVDLVLDQFSTGYESTYWSIDINKVKRMAFTLDKSQQSLAAIFNCLYQHYCDEASSTGSRWGDKSTPGSYSYILDLMMVFPQSIFIHIVRDGRDCVSSCVRSGFYDHSAVRAAYAWVDNIRNCDEVGRLIGPSRYCSVKYEELVDAPEKITRELCSFLEIEFNSNMLNVNSGSQLSPDIAKLSHHSNVMKPISRRSVDKWRDHFSPNSVDVIHRIMGSELQKHGYILP